MRNEASSPSRMRYGSIFDHSRKNRDFLCKAAMTLVHSSFAIRSLSAACSGVLVRCPNVILPFLRGGGLAHASAMGKNFVLYKIAERADPFGLAQFFWVGKENRHFAAFEIGQDTHQIAEILGHVVG